MLDSTMRSASSMHEVDLLVLTDEERWETNDVSLLSRVDAYPIV